MAASLLVPGQRCGDKGVNEGVRAAGGSGPFGLEECGDIEGVASQLDDPCGAFGVAAGNVERAVLQHGLQRRVNSITAVILFGRLFPVVNGMGTRSPRKWDRATGAAEGTSQGRNQWERGVRVRLGMVRVRLAADVTDIFDKRMLEAAASTQKRDVPFAGRA